MFFSLTAVANQEVTCVLGSGDKSISYTFELDYEKTGSYYMDDYTKGIVGLDLSFAISLDCDDEKECFLDLVIDSQIIEDEISNIGVTFNMNDGSAIILEEELTGAPDGKEYDLLCDFKTK